MSLIRFSRGSSILIELEVGNVGFSGGRKAGKLGEKSWEQGENQQQTQPTYDTGPELNPHWWEASTLISAPSLFPIFIVISVFTEYQFSKHFIMN